MGYFGVSNQFKENTFKSGHSFELDIARLVQRYTRYVYQNVKVPSKLTKSGETELDIVFCLGDFVTVVETKNVSGISGGYADEIWRLKMNVASGRKEYESINIIVQNNLHMSSLEDFYYLAYGETITVGGVIVVPEGCEFSEELETEVVTVAQFIDILGNIAKVCVKDEDLVGKIDRLLRNRQVLHD